MVLRRCKVMDLRLSELAPRHLESKFLRIDAEKAPFFVQKLQVSHDARTKGAMIEYCSPVSCIFTTECRWATRASGLLYLAQERT